MNAYTGMGIIMAIFSIPLTVGGPGRAALIISAIAFGAFGLIVERIK